MIKDCTAVILAGGESKRMGQDKASILLADKSLLQHAIDTVKPLFEDVVISVREPIATCAYPQLYDAHEQRAPLMGVVAALQQVKTNWVFVMAVDMPFISPDLIRFLATLREHKQAVVPMVDGFEQPLLAYYHQGCLHAMQQQIDAGDRSFRTLMGALDSIIVKQRELARLDKKMISFYDLDYPKDLKYAEKIVEKKI